jgi:hypothetical protein
VEAAGGNDVTLYDRDLLADFRTSLGININLPGFTIWGIKIRISIRFDITTIYNQAFGYTVGLVVDDINGTPPDPNVDVNSDWMWRTWYPLLPPTDIGQFSTTTAPTNTMFVRTVEIDCKSHRKMEEVGQSLFLVLSTTGGLELTEVTHQADVLVLLP